MAKRVLENVNFKITAEGKTVTQMIDSILARGSKFMSDLHILNVSLLHRAIEHKDVDGATRLLNGMGGGFRRSAIANWLVAYGPFKWVKDEDKKLYPMGGKFKLDTDRYESFLKDKAGNYKAAEADPFWEFEPEKEFKGIDILGILKQAVERAEKAQKEADTPEKKEKLKLKGLVQVRKLLKELTD